MVTWGSPADSLWLDRRRYEIPVGHNRDGTKVPKSSVSPSAFSSWLALTPALSLLRSARLVGTTEVIGTRRRPRFRRAYGTRMVVLAYPPLKWEATIKGPPAPSTADAVPLILRG